MIKPELITLTFVSIFLAVQLLGLYIGAIYYEAIQVGMLQPLVDNPQDISNSIYLFLYMLTATAIIILILKFRKNLLKIIEIFILFMSSWITFSFLFPIAIWYIDLGLILSIILVLYKLLKHNFLINTLSIIFSLSGVGALLGASLGILPSILFILIVSIYDFISVFLTKHMIFMAKSIVRRPTIFTLSIPSNLNVKLNESKNYGKKLSKVGVFNLGSGDIALPLIFLVSVLNNYGLKYALFSLVGVTIMLFLLLNWRIKEAAIKPRALPAMPFLTVGLFLGFLISLVI
jgi:presenilin-like A22 family membrane protease